MHLLQYISNVVLIVLILLSPIGCATQGGLSDDGIVNLNHFSFSRPENPLWNYGYSRRRGGHFFELSSGGENYSIIFEEENRVSKERYKSAINLIWGFLKGVKMRVQKESNELTVSNRFGNIFINNKKFYTADYAIKNGDYCSNEEVYVYIPFEKQSAHFLWIQYKKITRDKNIVRDCLKFTETINPDRLGIHQDFLNFLGSLKHKL